MATAKEDFDAVREWLLAEVKLDRYAEKLESNGFTSLETCCSINEDALDKMGIVMPYHRKRFLMFTEKLREKLGMDFTNEEDGSVSPNTDVTTDRSETGTEQQDSLINFVSEDESVSACNDQLPKEDSCEITTGEGLDTKVPDVPLLPPKKKSSSLKAPPPIPPRADLEEREIPSKETSKVSDTPLQDAKHVEVDQLQVQSKQPDVPAKRAPSKPPRRVIRTPQGSVQNGMQEQDMISCNSNADSVANISSSDEKEPQVQMNSTSSCPVLPNTDNGSDEASSTLQSNEETAAATTEPRVVPKAPERLSAKRPTPAPRPRKRRQSEDNVLVSDLVTDGESEGGSKNVCSAVLNDASEQRTQSLSLSGRGSDLANSSVGKPSTLPRSASAKQRPAPPPPPTRQTGSLKDLPKRQICDLPLPPVPVPGSMNHRQNKLISAPHQGASEPVKAQSESTDEYSLVQPLPRKTSQVKSQPDSTDEYSLVQPLPRKTSQVKSQSESTDEYSLVQPLPRKTSQVKSQPESTDEYSLVQPLPQKTPTVKSQPESTYEYTEVQLLPQKTLTVKSQPESTYEYSMVQPSPQKTSQVESSLYEEVWKGDPREYQRNNDTAEIEYESDDSLDPWCADLPEMKKRGDSTENVDYSKAIPNSLSPRVRKSEGYLWKQGGQKNNKGWRKRWFVFDGKDLRYYKDKDSLTESLHIIPVNQIKDIENVKDEKRSTFKVITPNRTFIFASENITEMNLWSQTLMEAIIGCKGDGKNWKSGGEMSDPDKEGWLKKQGHNVVADWKKRYVAIKGDKICYYDTYEDFIYATPINCINAALAKVKTVDGHKNRFVIITFHKSYSFQGDSEFDASSWIVAIETAIQIGLGDTTIREKVWENPSNRFCADCGMKDPVWASVNFCVCVCAKCIGVHRNLGVHCSRARSLLMDEKIWNPALIELMIKIGNDNANQLLEHKLPEDDKITPDANVAARREFIYSKYWEKKYAKYHQAFGDPEALGKVLRDTVVTKDILSTMELILNKVDVRYIASDAEDEKTPLELAEEAGQTLQAELLRQNGGEGKPDQNLGDDQTATLNTEASQSAPIEIVYEKEGFLQKKEGSWRKRWFLLKDRHLKYARGPHDKDDLVTIDLRAVTSLVRCPKGEQLQLDIVTVDKTHSLKADSEEELEGWYSALRSKQVFGVLLCQQGLGSDGIPHLVAKCLQFVETYGGLEMEGVYRVNGGQLTMKKLRTSFDQDAGSVLLTLDECGVHDVTGVLKQYLRQLPDPVIPGTMYKHFIAAGSIQDHNTRLQTIKSLINQLPKVNHGTLKAIISHLTKVTELVSVNKMGVPNIAMIFGPTLMSNESTGRMDDSSINQEFSIVGDMITYYKWLFDVSEEEEEKAQVIEEATQKIRELIELKDKQNNSGGEFTLDIYVKEKNDNPHLMKVSSEMTAGRLRAEIVSQKALSPDIDWVLFEVIDNGAMERAFQVREKVMTAANWGSGNYLIVKENYIAEQIAPYVGTLSIEGSLYIRDPKKNWKPSLVCLKNGYMSVNKERGSILRAIKSDKSDSEQWPLHKLTLYVGIPAEKATKTLDTSCGLTVVVKTDQEDIVRYMCAKDKDDRNRWLAATLNMKHPEGIWSDPTQDSEVLYSLVGPKGAQGDDSPLFLGRQSVHLRRQGSTKHIVDELRNRQKSLKRPKDRGPKT